MKNMTLAFLACLTLAAPVATPAMADAVVVDQTIQNHHLNTKDVFNGSTPSGTPVAPTPTMANTMAPPVNSNVAATPDAAFAAGMITHHQSGVDMAKAELANGKDPEMRKLAQSIVDSQGQEISRMQAWLAKQK